MIREVESLLLNKYEGILDEIEVAQVNDLEMVNI